MTTATTAKTSVASRGAALVLALVVSGCMSLAPRSRPASGNAITIDDVPARNWGENRCAAGALSEVLAHFGDDVSEEELSGSLLTARHGGVTTVDLLLAARERGFSARLARGDDLLLEHELASGRPLVIVIRVMDSDGSEDDLYHYVVLSGIDRERNLVRLHYGDGKRRWAPIDALRDGWRAAGYAVFLIGNREQEIASDDDFRRAVFLEGTGALNEAIALYRHYLSSHPDSALAWTNLGNAQSSLGQTALAEVSYRNAIFLEPLRCDALNNLAWLLLGERRLSEAEELARRALTTDCSERELVVDTLEQIVAAREQP